MNIRHLLATMAFAAVALTGRAVKVETTANLYVFYPSYTKIDLVCGQMPKAAQKDVEFCCEAAFTGGDGQLHGGSKGKKCKNG